MATARDLLANTTKHVEDSIGVRETGFVPRLSPTPQPQDIGRRRLQNAGTIRIDQVVPDPEQPRVEFDDASLRRFAKSIETNGQLAPIHVRWSSETSKWIIISGERRWRSTKAAGLTSIKCIFHETPLTKAEILEHQLIENLLREDLRPIEEARGFASLMKMHGWNGKQVAEALHVPESKVSRSLALLDLPKEIQESVEVGELAARAAYEISRLPDVAGQRKLAKTVVNEKLTHAQTANLVGKRKGKSKGRKPSRNGQKPKAEFWSETGAKVSVCCKAGANYHDVKEALEQALEETEVRIRGNIRLT